MLSQFGPYNKIAKQSLIGATLCFSGMGSIAIWMNVNVYYFSFFYIHDKTLSLELFNTLISFTALVGAIMALISMKTSQIVGTSKLIKICMLLYSASFLISAFQDNLYTFFVFYSLILGVTAGFSMVPITYCMYGHFGENMTGNVTGTLLGFFGIFQVIFIMVTTLIVNPENKKATILYTEGQNSTYIFDSQIAQNVPHSILALGILTFITCIPGSFILKTKQEADAIVQDQHVKLAEEDQPKVFETKNIEQQYNDFDIKKYIFDRNFLLLFFTSCNVSFQVFLVSLNFKVYGNLKINDDHFLMAILVVSSILAAFSKFVWGYLVDRYPYKNVLAFCLLIGGVFTMTWPYISNYRYCFMIWYTLITICERGFLTIGPPIMIKIFGVEVGTNLIPAYQIGFLIGIICVPFVQIVLLKFMTYDQMFQLSGCAVLLTNVCIRFIDDKQFVEKKNDKKDAQDQLAKKENDI